VTPSPSNTPANTPSPTPTNTPTNTPEPTPTPSNTPAYTPTNTPAYTPTNTPNPTPSNTPVNTPTSTPTPTPTKAPSGGAWIRIQWTNSEVDSQFVTLTQTQDLDLDGTATPAEYWEISTNGETEVTSGSTETLGYAYVNQVFVDDTDGGAPTSGDWPNIALSFAYTEGAISGGSTYSYTAIGDTVDAQWDGSRGPNFSNPYVFTGNSS